VKFQGGTREIKKKFPRAYGEKSSKKVGKSKQVKRPIPRLRKSITPGTVLIMLSGPYRGKKCVFLKQLKKSGLLLVSGPFRINGVPVRRVNQAYVIATSTHVPLTVKVPAIFDDNYFTKPKAVRKSSTPEDPFAPKKKKVPYPKERKEAQKQIDDLLVPIVKKIPFLARYMRARFSLSKAQFPHQLKF